jgi:hypothetical protein
LHIPAALEKSRSGNGGHIWLFFEEPIPASLARKLGSYALTETMERRPEIGLDSYDRFFPNQDTLPDTPCVLARDHRAVRRPAASSPRSQARSARV